MDDIKELGYDDIEKVYRALPDEARAEIDRICDKLIDRVKERHTGTHTLPFGRQQALELVAKTGIWMIETGHGY